MIKLIKNIGKQYFNNMKNQPVRITADITKQVYYQLIKGINKYD